MQTRAFCTLALAAALLPLAVFAEQLSFTGTTDRNPLLYRSGEKMVFKVTLVDKDNGNQPALNRKLVWERRGDDGKTEKGEAVSDQPLVVTTSIDQPGFVRLTVKVLDADGKPMKVFYDGGAGADVNQIQAWPLPADFNEFWDREVERLLKTPYKVLLTPVEWPEPDKVKVYKFAVNTYLGELPATGLIGIPVNAGAKSLKLHVSTIGYGFNRYWVNNDMIKQGCIFVTLARQGEDPIRDEAYYENLSKHELKDFCFRHNNDRYANDFYKMIIRNLRALQYAKSLPEWNGRDITVAGGSMGGFQAIALAALDPAVTKCNAAIPWVADLAGVSKFRRMGGWRPDFTETLGYFDTANLATRVKCPTDISIGLGDYVCPPSGQMILFRNLAGSKKLTARQNTGHGAAYGVETAEYTFEDVIR